MSQPVFTEMSFAILMCLESRRAQASPELSISSPKVKYVGAIDISCIEKANIINVTKIETILKAYGIVSRLLILYSSKPKKLMPIFVMP